jgi:hypothetical protein
MKGASTVKPIKPKITEGMVAKSSMDGFTHSRTFGPAKQERYKASPKPKGVARNIDKKVTASVPAISERAPKEGSE